MALAGLFPVVVSVLGASTILWYAVPIGFSCRSVWVVIIFGIWIISALITTMVYVYSDRKDLTQEKQSSGQNTDQWQLSAGGAENANERSEDENNSSEDTERKLWRWVLIKDAIIASCCLLTIFLSTCGVFNSCYCWSVKLTNKSHPIVPLATDILYADRANSVYSGVVITCIGIQVLFFFAIIVFWSGGLQIARWTESEKRLEWAHENKEPVLGREPSYLLFWYYERELEEQEELRKKKENECIANRRPTILENSFRGSISWISGGGNLAQ